MEMAEWILCPICGRKTHDKTREDTEIKHFRICPMILSYVQQR